MGLDVFGIPSNKGYSIWPYGEDKPYKTFNEYRYFTPNHHCEYDYDDYSDPYSIKMIRHTINKPRI